MTWGWLKTLTCKDKGDFLISVSGIHAIEFLAASTLFFSWLLEVHYYWRLVVRLCMIVLHVDVTYIGFMSLCVLFRAWKCKNLPMVITTCRKLISSPYLGIWEAWPYKTRWYDEPSHFWHMFLFYVIVSSAWFWVKKVSKLDETLCADCPHAKDHGYVKMSWFGVS